MKRKYASKFTEFESISSRFRKMIKEHGITQKEFCVQTGLSVGHLSKVLNGHAIPSGAMLNAIAKKGYDVRCNSIHPAFVDTPILNPLKQAFGEDEAVKKLARQIPMNKIGDTDDVAYAVLYLASDESKFMTGTELVLDGGLSAM